MDDRALAGDFDRPVVVETSACRRARAGYHRGMEWLLGIVIVLAVAGVAVLVARKGSRFPRPPEGVSAGHWKFVADPETRQVAWELPDDERIEAQVAIHFVQWQLFYFGNGSAAHDTSQELRSDLRALLADPSSSSWSLVPSIERAPHTLDLAGEFLDPSGFAAFPGVLGVPRKAESLHGAAVTIAQLALRLDSESDAVRRALERLLELHAEHGPARSLREVGPRAYAALHAAS